MKNYVADAEVVTVTAPAAVTSGDGVLVGALFGVAQYTAANGANVEILVEGAVTLPKAAVAITQGALVYWDNTNKNVTTTASGNTKIGVALIAQASGDATVTVRLNGAF